MAKPRKGKIKVQQKAVIRKKGSGSELKKVQGRPPADVAPTLRIKVKKKQ